MAIAAGRIGHEDRLSLVDHLDELRTRLIVSVVALVIAFGFCLWQNHALLHLINAPLITVTLLFALVISLPVILFELYGFVLPAFSPRERRIAMPLLAAIPFLFVIGVAFGYFVVLPAALRFFQNFNSGEFNVLVQANPYYKFVATILLAMGLVFQVPVAILAATRVGIVTPKQLRHNRRYAILACAAVAAFLPGDAVTLILETVPLYILYELSILVASVVARRDAKGERAEAA